MRLTCHDRRGPVAAPDPWVGGRTAWPRLEELAAAVGDPRWGLDLVLLTDAAMAELNGRWRGDAEPTDVLSFSYLEDAGAGPPQLAAGERGAARDLWLPAADAGPDEATPVAGELVLAPAFVLARCRARGWDPDLEWPLLVVHGCLHVLGWEHDAADDRAAMQAREADLLATAGLPHPLLERS